MQDLSVGIVGTSHKPDEHRLPIHPEHIGRIDVKLRHRMFFERGYAHNFGVSDEQFAGEVAGLRSREQLMEECDVLVLPKPLAEDLTALRPGAVLWGWPHCVQNEAITQVAIDRRLTLIAWEAMNHWTEDGGLGLHVFHKNNELAGYCSVIHALQLIGTAGAYGRRLQAVVISFGATGRGAVAALLALGVHDITVLTQRRVPAVAAPIPPARLVHYEADPEDPHRAVAFNSHGSRSVAEFLAQHDIVVNCVRQDTDEPLMFVTAPSSNSFHKAACSSTSPATRVWASNGRCLPRSRIQWSPSGMACTITPLTTARRICGTRQRGRSARRSSRFSGPSCRATPPGKPTRRSAGDRDPQRRRAEPQILSFQSRS